MSTEDAGRHEMGTTLGRFVVVRVLGEGGMGVVYEARDPHLDRSVALKVLRSHHGSAGSMRLVREAQALAQLAHPNVVAVHEVGVAGKQVFIAMEYVEGATLDVHLRARPRSWHEILTLFVQAGRGLAAAHARSIVHRDLKPTNLLVDGDGRVRVTDFGLARLAGDLGAATPSAGLKADTSSSTTVEERGDTGLVEDATPAALGTTPARGLLEERLTDAGSLVGTPRYMAPEQLRGLDATPASDQFAFCVAWWESLFGVHPLDGERAAPLARAPRWLSRVLEKGLARDPRARHPSVAALLDLVEQKLRRRRWLAVAAVGMVAVAGSGAAVGLVGAARAVDCDQAGGAIESIWTGDARARMTAAFTAARPYGADTAGRLVAKLDDHGRGWRRAHVESCRATHERGEQSVEMLDRRTACLDLQLGVLRPLVAALVTADGLVVDRAFEALSELRPVELCAPARLAAPGPPADPRTAALSVAIAEVAVEFRLGRYVAARPKAEAALAQARALGEPAFVARALVEHARIVNSTDARTARAELEEALGEAAKGGDRYTEAIAAVRLFRAAVEEGNAERIASLLPGARASAAAARIPSLEHEFAGAEARMLVKQRKPVEALAACARVAALEQPEFPPRAIECRCSAALNDHDQAQSIIQCQASLDERTRRFGAGHPETGAGLVNMMIVYDRSGQFAEAVAMGERVLRIYEIAYGDGTKVVTVLINLASSLGSLGRHAEAKAQLDRALAIMKKTSDRPSFTLGNIHGLLSGEAAALGDPAGAIEHAHEALRVSEASVGAEHPDLVTRQLDYARALMTDPRRLEEALEIIRRTIALGERVLPAGDARGGLLLAAEASCLLALGRARQAVPLAERSIAILAASKSLAAELVMAEEVLGKARLLAGKR